MKQTTAEKALDACREYAAAQKEIGVLTYVIGQALNKCPGINGQRGEYDEVIPHLKEAYAAHDEEVCYGTRKAWLDSSEVIEYLERECEHCLAAHKAIQFRKKVRQRLGIAKRRIAAIGRAPVTLETPL